MCIIDDTEDEDVNREYVEETNRDAVMIAAAKLVACDAVPKVKSLCCVLYVFICDGFNFLIIGSKLMTLFGQYYH